MDDIFNLDSDNKIIVSELQDEFRKFPSILYHYSQLKSEQEYQYDILKSKLNELESQEYVTLKTENPKITQKAAESFININYKVRSLHSEVLKAKRDLDTLKNYVESLKAKKDMLIQLGADMRKEV